MPIAIDILGKKILLIGGGRIAMHKIISLRQYCADIRVVALEVIEDIKKLGLCYTEKPYEQSDLQGSFLVYACTNITTLNEQVQHDCSVLGILVNVVDNPALCDFVSPAIYKKEFLSVAVTSNARNVYKSIEVRDRIKNFIENDYTQPL